jgi:hypothetical protein
VLGGRQGYAAARLLVGARQVLELTQGLDVTAFGRAASAYAGPQTRERRAERLGAERRVELGLGTGEVLR